MRTYLYVCLAVGLLLSGKVCAIKEVAEPEDMIVFDKVSSDARESGRKRAHEQEISRRAEAEKKVEMLRNIPPGRVQDWLDGKLQEVELESVVASARGTVAPAQAPATNAGVWAKRPLLLGSGALLLAFCYVAYSRQVQKTKADSRLRTSHDRWNNTEKTNQREHPAFDIER